MNFLESVWSIGLKSVGLVLAFIPPPTLAVLIPKPLPGELEKDGTDAFLGGSLVKLYYLSLSF